MTKEMRMQAQDAGTLPQSLEKHLYRALSQSFPIAVKEELLTLKGVEAPMAHIAGDHLGGSGAEGYDALLLALAHDFEPLAFEVDIRDFQRDELGEPQAGVEEEDDDGQVTHSEPQSWVDGGEQPRHLLLI